MIAVITLMALNAYMFLNIEKKNAFRVIATPPIKTRVEDEWTIYGTMGCGWTRKQLDYMKQKGKPFTFVDCDKGDCPDVEGFPTMIHSSGERVVGYKEV